MSDLAARLSAITEAAPGLRRAGVQVLKVDGIEMVLLPHEQFDTTDAKPSEPTDAANDALTYGLNPGDKLPGFTRPDDIRGGR